jgi:hypothetical protein
MDDKGNITVLREASNGFTCFRGHPGVVGDVAMCTDAPSRQRLNDAMSHKPKPSNTQPGVTYMLAGRHRRERERSHRHARQSDQRTAASDDHVDLRPRQHRSFDEAEASRKLDYVGRNAPGPADDPLAP